MISPYLLSLLMGGACFGALVWRARGRPARPASWLQRAWASVLVGLTLGGLVVPALYAAIGYWLAGAPVEQRHYPGTGPDYLLFWLAAAALAGLGYSIDGYLRLWRASV